MKNNIPRIILTTLFIGLIGLQLIIQYDMSNQYKDLQDSYNILYNTYLSDMEQCDIQYQSLTNEYDNLNNDLANLTDEYNNLNNEYDLLSADYESILIEDMDYNLSLINGYGSIEYLNKYKTILAHYNMPSSMYDYYSKSEIEYMCRCVETEVYQCDFNSKCNVASVILNRVKSSRFPNNPISVVTAPNQFAYGRTSISESTRQAVEYAILIGDTAHGCIGFKSDCCPSTWNGWHYVFSDNAVHYFYK